MLLKLHTFRVPLLPLLVFFGAREPCTKIRFYINVLCRRAQRAMATLRKKREEESKFEYSRLPTPTA